MEKSPKSEDHEEAAIAQEAADLEHASEKMEFVNKHWDQAVERAKAMPEGGLHSVWTQPVVTLVQEAERALQLAGVDIDSVKPSATTDRHQHDLPEVVRGSYRHGRALIERLPAELASRRRQHARRRRSASPAA